MVKEISRLNMVGIEMWVEAEIKEKYKYQKRWRKKVWVLVASVFRCGEWYL
jgi:hypothetical protein